MLVIEFLKKTRHYTLFQLVFVLVFLVSSSLGAFFHFLLDHEISIVESWIYNNHWELLIFSKLLSLFFMVGLFRVRLYEINSLKQLIKDRVRFPDDKVLVISFFMLTSYTMISGVVFSAPNIGYWYNVFVSYVGVFIFFSTDFIILSLANDFSDYKSKNKFDLKTVYYPFIFILAFRIIIPDYHNHIFHVILCITVLFYLSKPDFKNWSNVVCFILVFVAPMNSFFGLDPVWGNDFSPFMLNSKLRPSFLAVIWMISFSYFNYRDQFISGLVRLFNRG
jgi:hypothetical protein